jgi:exodeoxyribonuclease VII small subunit
MTYQEALQELKEIALKIESEELNLDNTELLLARAQELAEICRTALRRVNDKLNEFQALQNRD